MPQRVLATCDFCGKQYLAIKQTVRHKERGISSGTFCSKSCAAYANQNWRKRDINAFKKIHDSLISYYANPINREKTSIATSKAMAMLKTDLSYREKMRVRNIKINNSPVTREKRRLISQRLAQDPEYIAKITPNDEVKQKIRQKVLERYRSDPDYRSRVLSSRRPTDIEARLIEIIEKYMLPYRYTGDGSFWVGGKNPDFVNVNSEKIAIDLFGDFWHEPSEIEPRKAVFAEYGWHLIILWGHELKQLSDSELVGVIQNAKSS